MRLAFACVVVFALGSTARAYPLYAPQPVPSAIAGPTDPHPAAIFYNPAALGPLRGVHVWLDGGANLHEGSIQRAPLEGQSFPSASINWADPIGFAAVTWDLNTESFIVGLGTYTPLSELSSYSPSGPLRFHEIDQAWTVLQQTAAAAYRVSGRLYIGAAFNVTESWISWRMARDLAPWGGSAGIDNAGGLCGGPCGLENSLAEQRMRLRGFGWGLGFSVGVLGRPIDRLWLALSYESHPFNTGQGTDVPMHDQTRAIVAPAPGQHFQCTDASGAPAPWCRASDLIIAGLPDILHAGMRVAVTQRFQLESSLRWIHYGLRDALDVLVQSPQLTELAAQGGAPPAQQLYARGLQDAWAVEVSGRIAFKGFFDDDRWPAHQGAKLVLSPSVLFESSAIDRSAVNAAALDGEKIDVALAMEWRPAAHLVIGARAGVTGYVIGDVQSRFDPRALARCVDARYALDQCSVLDDGRGLASASGNYLLVVAHVSAALGLEF